MVAVVLGLLVVRARRQPPPSGWLPSARMTTRRQRARCVSGAPVQSFIERTGDVDVYSVVVGEPGKAQLELTDSPPTMTSTSWMQTAGGRPIRARSVRHPSNSS